MFLKNSQDVSNKYPAPWKVFSFETIGSTNNSLKEYIRRYPCEPPGYQEFGKSGKHEAHVKTPEYTVFISKEQTLARGRLKRQWSSEKGGLWISSALTLNRMDPSITLVMGLALLKSVRKFFPHIQLKLKWPNDLVTPDNIKIAGILCESVIKDKNYFITGTGLNVFNIIPPVIEKRASTLKNLCLQKNVKTDFFDKTPIYCLAHEYLSRIKEMWPLFIEKGFKIFMKEYMEESLLMNKLINIVDPLTGKIISSGKVLGIKCDGRLEIEDEKKKVILVHSGEVTFSNNLG